MFSAPLYSSHLYIGYHVWGKMGQLPQAVSKLDPETIANLLINFSAAGGPHRL